MVTVTRRFVFLALVACTLPAVLAQAAFGQSSFRPRNNGATAAKVACTPPRDSQIHCTMTIKGGAGVNGTVSMRIMRGTRVMARGKGKLTRGRASLTMRVLRRMRPARYTISMVVTVTAKMVIQLR